MSGRAAELLLVGPDRQPASVSSSGAILRTLIRNAILRRETFCKFAEGASAWPRLVGIISGIIFAFFVVAADTEKSHFKCRFFWYLAAGENYRVSGSSIPQI
ncbi:hypothetical protein [Tahibacter aquaticus]|uniref:hypothetical protein n=1 Tax=Tahibacter aquaticus TaxID=520092 RepID=UPI00105DD9F2|nr:hypothetical protein [Tahibacter aquaticus]